MRSEKQGPTSNNWFPLDIERYDRNPALTPAETTALQRHTHEHHPAKATLHDQVRRLIEPLDDLFSHTKLRPTVRPFLVLYLLREMNCRGRTFWGWTTEEWIETINKHAPQQQHLVALAYLFGGFTDLDTAGSRPPLYIKLAEKIFGQTRLDGVLERIRNLLVEWGHSGRATMQHIPRTRCEALLLNRSPHLEDLTIECLRRSQRGGRGTRKRKAGTDLGPVSGWLQSREY
jgi:hypothetical protein